MNDKVHIFDKPQNVRRVLWALVAMCIATIGADFVYHRHIVHPWEGVWGFYAIYGFVACVVLVLVAKELRKLLMRAEDYYDRDG
ncbi:MAG: hypothetical protein HN529_07910 [Acidiferrobacteraceae bacterium]|jgi:hypothetical protein|nr:hypothetical protein [Acidiferrobacteraceae bacterium]MDE0976496.1 hypothetical protein [Arenicellales bacterium]HIE76988.1 hypothetical protein [Gammaproteobacteria bacterium]MBT3640193.1 hypothetical protein [Acidiferrobacteraceae bacterium]MBT3769903.1 hypothetical protein [Acidiferrobacteraceae bacterium]